MKKQNRLTLFMPNSFIGLLLNDILTFFIAFFLAHTSRVILGELVDGVVKFPSLINIFLNFWWFFIFIFLIYLNKGLYFCKLPFWQEASRIFSSSIIAFIIIFATISLTKSGEFTSRAFVIFLFIYWFVLSVTFRYLFKSYYFIGGPFAENACVVGSYDSAMQVYNAIKEKGYMGYDIKGIVVIGDIPKKDCDIKILGHIEDIENIVVENRLTIGFILPKGISDDKLVKLNIIFKKVITAYSGAVSAFSNIEPMQIWDSVYGFLGLNNNLKSKLNIFFKRLFDIFLSVVLLPFLLIIILFIAILIKINSKGNIFYKHERVGMNGKPIYVYKFRSMYLDSADRLKEILSSDPKAKEEWETYYKLKNDPRITKVGAFLRKTSLDELPQIFNVIKGEMSFIGPRPVIREELEKYYKEYSIFYESVRPGISGLWQVSGRSDADYDLRVAKDMWYVLNWSAWVDFLILCKTPIVVLKRKGAY